MEADDVLLEEIAALEATLLDDLNVVYNGTRPEQVSITLHPATADNRDQQFVRMTMTFQLPRGYPEVSPQVVISNPRGISEQTVQRVLAECQAKMEDYKGEPVLYQLMEIGRDHLTDSNMPSVPCVICLYDFTEEDVFTKTACYHYFHTHCMARYIENFLNARDEDDTPPWQEKEAKEVVCPVCREPISYQLETLTSAPPPVLCSRASGFQLTAELRSLQQKMSSLLRRQQERGGVIDPEEERNKYLLITEPTAQQRGGGGDRARGAAGPSGARPRPRPQPARSGGPASGAGGGGGAPRQTAGETGAGRGSARGRARRHHHHQRGRGRGHHHHQGPGRDTGAAQQPLKHNS